MSDFRESFVKADGFHIRYLEAGPGSQAGSPVVHLHGAGGLMLTPAHGLLSHTFRMIVLEMPGFGNSAENTRNRTMPELADTVAAAIGALGLDRVHLMGTSFGAKVALWTAVRHPAVIQTLVLEGPAAIRLPGMVPPSGTPEEIARRLYAHPERMPPLPPLDPAVAAKQRALVSRVRGPDRDADLEARMRELPTPTLVVFGTLDDVIAPAVGRIYKELMPDAHLGFIYDAGHEAAMERPEAFAEIVTDFLLRRDAFVISRRRTVLFP